MSSEDVKLHGHAPRTYSHDADECAFMITCWSCRRDFTVWIGYGNLNQSWFDCPHCKVTNEID